MERGRVSVLIPSRLEPHLVATLQDVLKTAQGDIEVIAVLDGWWPEQALPNDPRLRVLHWGTAQGLRAGINAAVAMSSGEFLFKLDAHCALCPGFDLILKRSCNYGDVVVPAKYSLDPDTWTRFRDPWHYFYLKWPWETGEDTGLGPTEKFVGLQDKNYDWSYCQQRESARVDDILSYQGSAWMLMRKWWDYVLPNGMDAEHYYYAQEPQEVGLATWLQKGSVKIVKDAWYAHLWKGRGVNKRQFQRERAKWDAAQLWSCRHWMAQPGFPALIEQFGPLPGWPSDWQAEAARRLT